VEGASHFAHHHGLSHYLFWLLTVCYQGYIEHRLLRERQVVEVLRKAHPEALSSLELVDEIYGDISYAVRFSAQNNIELHLGKLQKEGKIKGGRMGTWSAVVDDAK